jgi:sporulation protein YlmC with PRC-barrel domain
MLQTGKSLTKDKLVGMKVIDSEGTLLGNVKDVGFTIGKSGISLNVEDKNGQMTEIAWDAIQGAADFIVLKPAAHQQAQPVQAQPAQAQPVAATVNQTAACRSCGGTLTYIPQYQRWYCYKCQKYA